MLYTYTTVLVGCGKYVWSSSGFGGNEHAWLALVPWNCYFPTLLGVVHFSRKLSTMYIHTLMVIRTRWVFVYIIANFKCRSLTSNHEFALLFYVPVS